MKKTGKGTSMHFGSVQPLGSALLWAIANKISSERKEKKTTKLTGGRVKLTDEQVKKIRKLHHEGKTYSEIMAEFDLKSEVYLRRLIHGDIRSGYSCGRINRER